jgi:hypothetical protein
VGKGPAARLSVERSSRSVTWSTTGATSNFPAPQHANAIGVSARVAYGALETLRDAGLIKVKHRGSRNQATVWSYVPVAGFDSVKARKVFQAASRRAAERIVAATLEMGRVVG